MIGKDIRRSIRELERQTGRKTFGWRGNNYVCVPNVLETSKLLAAGGFEPEADLALFVRRELLPSAPAEKDAISFDGGSYRISEVRKLPGDTALKLSCTIATK